MEQPQSFHPFKNFQTQVFTSLSTTTLYIASPSTFPPDIEELADTWLAKLQENKFQ